MSTQRPVRQCSPGAAHNSSQNQRRLTGWVRGSHKGPHRNVQRGCGAGFWSDGCSLSERMNDNELHTLTGEFYSMITAQLKSGLTLNNGPTLCLHHKHEVV